MKIALGQKLASYHYPFANLTAKVGLTLSVEKIIASAKFKALGQVRDHLSEISNSCLVFLVRHGETDWNREKRFQGWRQNSLNQTGEEQARSLVNVLSGLPIKKVYSSDLIRGSRAAEIFAAPFKASLTAVPELRELDFGDWSELTKDQVLEKYPRESRLFYERPHRFRAPAGESFWEQKERAEAAFWAIVKSNLGQPIVLMGHGWLNKIILLSVFGIHLSQFWKIPQADNTGIDVLEVGQSIAQSKLWLFHYSGHLSESAREVTGGYDK
jgi:broad specificity phosphatase PhoE